MKLRFRYIHLVQGIAVLVFTAALITVFIPLSNEADRRLEALKLDIVGLLEQKTGRRISIESISPSVFRFVEIRDLSIYDGEDRNNVLLTIDRVRVHYDIFRLFSGDPLSSIREISFENSHFTFDTEQDEDLLELIKTAFLNADAPIVSSSGNIPSQLGNLVVSGKNISLTVKTPDGTVSADEVFFRVRPGESSFRFEVRSGLTGSFAFPGVSFSDARTSFALSGTLGRDLTWLDCTLELSMFTTEGITLKPQTFHVAWSEHTVELRKVQDSAPIDLSARIDTASGGIEAVFTAESFMPSALVELDGRFGQYDELLETAFSGAGLVRFDPNSGTVSYTGTLNAERQGVGSPFLAISAGDDRSKVGFELETSGGVEFVPSTGELSYEGTLSARLEAEQAPWLSSVSASFRGTEAGIALGALTVRTAFGEAAFSGSVGFDSYLPEGTLRVRNTGAEYPVPFDAELSLVLLPTGSLSVTSESVSYGAMLAQRFDAELRPVEGAIEFVMNLSVPAEKGTGTLVSEGALQYDPSPFLQAFVHLSGFPVGTIAAAVDAGAGTSAAAAVPAELHPIMVESDLSIITDFHDFSLAAPLVSLVDPALDTNAVTFSLALTESFIELRNAAGSWGSLPFSGSFIAELPPSEAIRVSSEFVVSGIPYRVEGTVQPGVKAELAGSYGFHLTLLFDDRNGIGFQLQTLELPIPFGTTERPHVSASVLGSFRDRDGWDVIVTKLEVKGVPGLPSEGVVALSGRLGPGSGTIRTITFSDRFSTVSGSGEIELEMPELRRVNGTMELVGSDGAERYRLAFGYDTDRIDGTFEFFKTPIERFGLTILRGRASGSVSFSGTLPIPDLALTLSLDDVQFNGEPVEGEVTAELTDRYLSVSNLDVLYVRNRLSSAACRLDLSTGRIEGAFSYKRNTAQSDFSAGLAVEGRLAESKLGKADLSRLLKLDFDLSVSVSGLDLAGRKVEPWALSLSRRESSVSLSGGPGNAFSGSFELPGNFTMTATDRFPVAFTAAGKFDGNNIEAKISKLTVDLTYLNRLAESEEIRFLSGTGRGELAVKGPVNDPDFSGSVIVSNVTAVSSMTPDRIGPFTAVLSIQGKNVTLSRFRTGVGSGSLTIDGTALLDHWGPTEYRIGIATDGERGAHIAYDFQVIKVDGYGRGRLTVTGDLENAVLAGDLLVSNCDISLSEIDPDRVHLEPEYGLRIDLKFRTGRQVQFIWPERFPVLRASADSDQALHVVYDSRTEEYSIDGTINVRGGEIFYFNRNFLIREGRIAFSETEEGFDPRLTARAEIRETIKNETAKIYLVADENRLSTFSPRFESDPPATDAEILGALGQSFSVLMSSGNLGEAVLMGLDLGSHFGLIKNFERAVKESLNLDLFSIRTKMVENIVRDQLFARDTAPLDNSSMLGKYLDNTTLLVGKYIGSDLFLESMIQLSSADASASNESIPGGLKIDWELSLEWKTPFFVLDWSFLPRHPENLFLSDTTFSFSWKYSF